MERRDSAARAARDRLAAVLGVHPKRLAMIDAELAALLAFRLEQSREAEQAASHDELTGALNRAAGRRILERELQRASRAGGSLAVLFVDVNGLKAVNDAQGHAAGDQVLRRLGDTFTSALRPYDVPVRWGGDEFVVVLPDCDLSCAGSVAARLGDGFAAATGHSLTSGAAGLRPGDSLAALVARADAAMYEAKRSRTVDAVDR